MFVKILISSFAILFDKEFWEYSIFTLIPFIGYFVLLKKIIVKKANTISYNIFHFAYPVIAAFTIIPLALSIIFYPAIARLIIDKDSEPLLGLMINGFAYMYINIFISLGSFLFKFNAKIQTK